MAYRQRTINSTPTVAGLGLLITNSSANRPPVGTPAKLPTAQSVVSEAEVRFHETVETQLRAGGPVTVVSNTARETLMESSGLYAEGLTYAPAGHSVGHAIACPAKQAVTNSAIPTATAQP